jgi:hypothetical protein
MTHDELLAQLEGLWHDSYKAPGYQALRAVVRLHKPQEITLPNGEWGTNCILCDGFDYPCPTIRVIKRELK